MLGLRLLRKDIADVSVDQIAEGVPLRLARLEVTPLADGGLDLLRPPLRVGLAFERCRLNRVPPEAHLNSIARPTILGRSPLYVGHPQRSFAL